MTDTVTLAGAKRIVAAFKPNTRVDAQKVRSILPYVGMSAAAISEQVFERYAEAGVRIPFAFGENTVATALWVARRWDSLPATARAKCPTGDVNEILGSLVQIRRTHERLPYVGLGVKFPAGAPVSRIREGKKSYVQGGQVMAAGIVAALAKESNSSKWLGVVVGVHGPTMELMNAKRRGIASDDALEDVTREHNDRAESARADDPKTQRRNENGKRASKHERDPLEPATPGNSPDALPGAGGEKTPAPAARNPLADVSVGDLIRELDKRITLGYVPTGREDGSFENLAAAWSARVTDAPARSAGKYLERMTAAVR